MMCLFSKVGFTTKKAIAIKAGIRELVDLFSLTAFLISIKITLSRGNSVEIKDATPVCTLTGWITIKLLRFSSYSLLDFKQKEKKL